VLDSNKYAELEPPGEPSSCVIESFLLKQQTTGNLCVRSHKGMRLGERRSLVKRRTSRRDFLKAGGVGLAGAALLGVAGCGSQGGMSGNEKGTANEITVAVSSSPSATALRKMAPGFEKQTGVMVKFVELPYEQLASKVLLAA